MEKAFIPDRILRIDDQFLHRLALLVVDCCVEAVSHIAERRFPFLERDIIQIVDDVPDMRFVRYFNFIARVAVQNSDFRNLGRAQADDWMRDITQSEKHQHKNKDPQKNAFLHPNPSHLFIREHRTLFLCPNKPCRILLLIL